MIFSTASRILCAALFIMFGQSHAQQKPAAIADGYPAKPVKIIVGSSAGGGNDVVARLLAQKMSERTGAQFIVDNKVGANGVLAMDTTLQSAPDGYTLFSAGNLMVLNGVLKRVSYDVRAAFDPVAQMTSQPYLLLVAATLPIGSVKELVAYSKGKPGSLAYASSGVGSVNHLGTELLKLQTGIEMVHIPYKGNAQAFSDMLSGRVQVIFANGISSTPHIKSGKLRALAIGSPRRVQGFPDLPTVEEAGLAGFELGNAYFLYVPAKTPRNITQGLNREVIQIMNSRDVKAKLAADGAEPGVQSTVAELKEKYIKEYAMWESFINKSGLRLSE